MHGINYWDLYNQAGCFSMTAVEILTIQTRFNNLLDFILTLKSAGKVGNLRSDGPADGVAW